MASTEITDITARAIQSEVAHPLGAMRMLPGTDEQVALTIITALDEAGYVIVPQGGVTESAAPQGK